MICRAIVRAAARHVALQYRVLGIVLHRASGGVCRELFETRMMLRPPHSPSLPEVITDAAKDFNDAFKIALTERLLLAAGHDDTVGRPLTDGLRALNNLRVIEAHVLSTDDVMKQLKRWGVTKMPSSMRLLWHVAVDAIATALHDLATLIRDESRLTRV